MAKGFIPARTVLLLLLFATACSGRTIDGSGNVRSESRAISNVHTLSLGWSGDMILTQGESESLTITADDNLLPLITSNVRQGELVITIDRPYRSDLVRPSQPARYELTVRDLNAINVTGSAGVEADSLQVYNLALAVSGSGHIHIDQLEANELQARLTGSGSIGLAGQVAGQQTSISGSGTLRAAELHSRRASVTVTGSGKATVRVEEALDVNVSGSGSVAYYGQPVVSQTVTGSGSIQAMEE
jgi:hypothetical protein